MPSIPCSFTGCTYATGDVGEALAIELIKIHGCSHAAERNPPADVPARQRAPKIERPKISCGSSEETWNTFSTRWTMFKRGTNLSPDEVVYQLFQCCDEHLGDVILRCNPAAVEGDELTLFAVIKSLAVVPVARVVRRTDLLALKQDHGEATRTFLSRIRGKATTCAYTKPCGVGPCTAVTDFTEVIVKDILIAGLVDEEIKKDILGWSEVDTKSVEETVSYIEAKEMARDALNKSPVTAAGISSYKANTKKPKEKEKIKCPECSAEVDKFVWNQRQGRMIEVSQCLSCWKKTHTKDKKKTKPRDDHKQEDDETGALLIGAVETPRASCGVMRKYTLLGTNNEVHGEYLDMSSDERDEEEPEPPTIAAVSSPVVIDHHLFDSKNGWKRAESMTHPTLRLRVTTEASDYKQMGAPHPDIMPSHETAVTDTGAMSCLWGQTNFYRCGFKDSDLIPVKRTIIAANREKINILGAVFLRLSGTDALGNTHTAAVMVYVTPDTNRFYLSRSALIQLRVIPKDFPKVGAVMESCSLGNKRAECGCLLRELPPSRPETLPFKCCPENNLKMKEWLRERFQASTFNDCPHQKSTSITGPELKFHLKPDATFDVAHTPCSVPLHWQEELKEELDKDVSLGVIERVLYGEPSRCCHRMVVRAKPNGSLRRTVDMSSLNQHCLRETHHVKPPFQQAKAIPRNTWKSVTDARDGYHSVPLRAEDRYLTTFITPWGRYRYCVAPQGATISGDAYARRYDEIIADVERKTKCVDDTALWDEELEDHWWRIVDFLELVGRNGVTLNYEKFQFAKRDIDFAGFHITETMVKPQDKFLRAIADFPTPKKTTDIRAWFGLINHVAHYNRLLELVAPFCVFLGKNKKFEWNDTLEEVFQKSKQAVIEAIKEGVEIFDLNRPTCLHTDYSEIGVGYFLSQKHCECPGLSPGCCNNGWQITLAGSRFLKPAESRYSPVEGEALAVAWSLEQTRYFTLGCKELTVMTDHKPLLCLFKNS